MVVTGMIDGNSVTLHAIAGTDSATGFSLAENGATIAYTRHHDLRLFKVPVTGGTPVPTPAVYTVLPVSSISAELTGVSCKGSICIVALSRVFLTDVYSGGCAAPCVVYAKFLPGDMQLQQVSLATGVTTVVRSEGLVTSPVFASPQFSPISNDLVVQRGGTWGHIQTAALMGRGKGHIHLLTGIIP